MNGLLNTVWSWVSSHIVQEWFIAFITVIVTMIIFLVQQKTGNRISRSDFIYRVSTDFNTNERILKVYEWIESCRRENRNRKNHLSLTVADDSTVFSDSVKLDFTDIDSYIDHFESVYLILGVVKIRDIDELFQQRFFTFMHNPYIQREELFECFYSDHNDFLLYRKWVLSAYRRMRYDSFRLAEYLGKYTCGDYEYKTDREEYNKLPLFGKLRDRRLRCGFMLKYVELLCDPKCVYGYYRVSSSRGEAKTVRIIKSVPADFEAIMSLQEKVCASMEHSEYFMPSTPKEIEMSLTSGSCFAVQVNLGARLVAFAYIILEPDDHYSLVKFADAQKTFPRERDSVLDLVFTDPDFRGYGLQRLLIEFLSQIARFRGRKSVWATVQPENSFSSSNFELAGFRRMNTEPIERYGGVRDVYCRDVRRLKSKNRAGGEYYVYPYF